MRQRTGIPPTSWEIGPIGDEARRLRIVNAVAATAFVIGGSLFAIGAALAQAGVDEVA